MELQEVKALALQRLRIFGKARGQACWLSHVYNSESSFIMCEDGISLCMMHMTSNMTSEHLEHDRALYGRRNCFKTLQDATMALLVCY
eukprot:357832-Chlamydomonas_euryale.AAC.1